MGSRSPHRKGQFWGKGAPIVKYRDWGHSDLHGAQSGRKTNRLIVLLMIQNCLNQYQDTQLLKIPPLIKYALVLLLFLDVTPTVPLPHAVPTRRSGARHNSTHSTLGSPIPTLSPKVNLTLILRLTLTLALTLLTATILNKKASIR